jgi:hypothetical protein
MGDEKPCRVQRCLGIRLRGHRGAVHRPGMDDLVAPLYMLDKIVPKRFVLDCVICDSVPRQGNVRGAYRAVRVCGAGSVAA